MSAVGNLPVHRGADDVDPDITPAQVRAATDRIRDNLEEAYDLIVVMYETQAWRLLGHATWADYVDGEFKRGRLPREFIGQLRDAGFSSRAIAPVVGVSYSTVLRELNAGGSSAPPDVTGIDGKHYVATLAISPVPVEHTAAVKSMIEEITPRLHPACAVWPWMDQGELEDLASSIAKHGLIYPITLTPDDMILDGKVRLVACLMSGVKPTTRIYDGEPGAYVISMNLHRQRLTASQRAMGFAHTGEPSVALGDLVTRAREIAAEWPHRVDAILSGVVTLRDVYGELVQDREDRSRRHRAAVLLASIAPDVAEREGN